MSIMRRVIPFSLLTVLALGPAVAAAQAPAGRTVPVERVARAGVSDAALDRRLARVLAWWSPAPLVLAGDTLIAAADTVDRTVLVLDATLILEGTITGDLILVDAGAFVRPGSRVEGDLVNMGGGLYRSEAAWIGGSIIDLPGAHYRVVREPEGIVIEAFQPPQRLIPDGLAGVHVPTYDRANGLTLAVGATYRFPMLGPVLPSVRGRVGWRTQPGEPLYGAAAAVERDGLAVEIGYEEGSATSDAWIRGDLTNSLNYLWDGRDYRNYHQVERRWAGVRHVRGDARKRFLGTFSVRGQVEDARTLPGGEPWHLLGDSTRANPPIDDGRTSSIIAAYGIGWHGTETWFEGSLEYEGAREWMDGAFEFDRAAVAGLWAMHALADHTLSIKLFAQRPLGDGALPRQRWTYVGGTGTLQTVEFARYAGDRVAFVETRYAIPIPDRYRVPVLGAPDLVLIHAAGMAWTEGQDRPLRQEVGLELAFLGVKIRYMLDPSDASTGDLDVGVSTSFGSRYPWQ